MDTGYRRALGFILLLLGCQVVAADTGLTRDHVKFRSLSSIEEFGQLEIRLHGSAKKLGIDEQVANNLLIASFKEYFPDISHSERFDKASLMTVDREKGKKIGYIVIDIWTVDYRAPNPFHIDARIGNFGTLNEFSASYLGISDYRQMRRTVEQSIPDLVAKLGRAFRKSKRELNQGLYSID